MNINELLAIILVDLCKILIYSNLLLQKTKIITTHWIIEKQGYFFSVIRILLHHAGLKETGEQKCQD